MTSEDHICKMNIRKLRRPLQDRSSYIFGTMSAALPFLNDTVNFTRLADNSMPGTKETIQIKWPNVIKRCCDTAFLIFLLFNFQLPSDVTR